MKKPTLLLIIVTLLSHFSFAQSDNWNLAGFTPAGEVEILDDLSEAENLQKGELIFAKAKGVFSISPINTINNRALLKLKSEASLRGASHIFIDYRNIENSVVSKSSMYSARIYKQEQVSIAEVKKAIEGKKLLIKMETKYSRNGWKASVYKVNDFININLNAPLEEKNGKVYIKLRNKDGDPKSGRYEGSYLYEIVASEGNRLLVFKENIKGTSMSLLGVEIE
ncbi:hypothetical protein ACFSKL_13245 [Belliella marina]|uniref:Uncharacterized protein n=1 Tax=Belliella marina TaxID=1644146 RepID=A0ABW4VM41_9BACT